MLFQGDICRTSLFESRSYDETSYYIKFCHALRPCLDGLTENHGVLKMPHQSFTASGRFILCEPSFGSFGCGLQQVCCEIVVVLEPCSCSRALRSGTLTQCEQESPCP